MLLLNNTSLSLGTSIFLLTTAVTFVIYVSTTSSSIAGGDAGELIAEGCQLGTSHPPGYPLYTIIVFLVTTLGKLHYPTLTPAYLVNITSCVFGSITSGLISLIVYNLTGEASYKTATKKGLSLSIENVSRGLVSISTGLLCAFSPLMWQYNTSAEVFALNNLFIGLTVYVLVMYTLNPNSRSIICIGSFVSGLAMTNQHTSILLILPVVVYVFYKSSMLTKPKLLLMSALSFMFGISLYVLLPLFAITNPHAGSWGNVSTVSGFIHHFLRRDYGTLQLYSGDSSNSEGMIERTLSWTKDLVVHQICPFSFIFILLLGIMCGLQFVGDKNKSSKELSTKMKTTKKKKKKDMKDKKHKKMQAENNASSATWKMILFALVFYLGVFHSLSNLPLSNPLLYGIHQRFWQHPNMLVFILLGIGMHKATVVASCGSSSRLLALSSVVLLLPVTTYFQNYYMSDQSNNNYFRKYALSILETLPTNSLLIINYDQQWTSIRYLQECEGVRSDVTSINLSMMTFEWWQTKHELYETVSFPGTHYTRGNTVPWANGGFTFLEFIDANTKQFGENIFIGGRLNFEDATYHETYREEPFGLVRKIQSREASGTTESAESYRTRSLEVWKTIASHLSSDLPSKDKYPPTTWESTIRIEFFAHLVSRATHLLDLALEENDGSSASNVLTSIAESAAWLELASAWDSDTFAEQSSMKKNLGLAYMNMVRSKSDRFPVVEDIFDDAEIGTNGTESEAKHHTQNWWTDKDDNWKEWAATRWRHEWSAFLALPSSKAEPGYTQIQTIYDAVMSSASANSRH